MIPALLNEQVRVKRRTSTGVDALNNPVYGNPTSGDGWDTVYSTMPCRIALSDNKIKFDRVGERVLPYGTMYYPVGYILNQEDRVLILNSTVTANQTEYVVTSIKVAYKTGSIIDHLEATLDLP